jgi:hypothetical protein
MKKLYLLIILALAAPCLYAITDTIKIDVSTLEYASDFERQQFQNLEKNGTFNALNFLYCLDSTVTPAKAAEIEKKLNKLLEEKIGPAAKNSNTDKALKAMFKQIHDNLLTKYVSESRFEVLLDKGEYNCVTASALYALAFEKYGIPYQLRSTTDHVYVIANPGPTQMIIETTDPVGGAYTYSEAYKKTYVDMLKRQKMISKTEYDDSSIETLFQKYYYKADTINMRQLISYHYSNDGVWLMRDERYSASTNQLLKAYYLNNNSQITHLLSVAMASAINRKFEITDTADINRYFLFLKIKGETDYDGLYNDYVQASDDLLMRKDDLPTFENITNCILGHLSDSITISKFQEHYYLSKAVVFATKQKFLPAFENIYRAHCMNPKNVRVNLLYDQLNKYLYGFLLQEVEDGADLDSIINAITKAGIGCEKEKADLWLFNSVMLQAEMAFNDNKITEGNSLLAKGEKMVAEKKLTGMDHIFIERAYSSAQKHFYVKYEIAKAKEYLVRGLKLDPENEKLKEDLKTLNNVGSYTRPTYNTGTNPPPPPPVYYNNGSAPRYNNTPPTKPRTVIVKTPK